MHRLQTTEYYILITGNIYGFYAAWNIGANDVPNSMAFAVGAKFIAICQAIFIVGILNIIGAQVTQTIRRGYPKRPVI